MNACAIAAARGRSQACRLGVRRPRILARENAERLQHDASRSRRREGDHRAAVRGADEWRPPLRPVGGQVGGVEHATVRAHRGDQGIGHRSAIEGVPAVRGDRFQRPGEVALHDPEARRRRLAVLVRKMARRPGSAASSSRCFSTCDRRCGESSSAKPSRASRMAGASTSASGSVPKAACSVSQPATSPGTATARPPRRRRSGRGCPWSKKRSGVAAPGARSRKSSAYASPLASRIEREAAAADAARRRMHDAARGGGGDRGVDRAAAAPQDLRAGLGGEAMLGRDRAGPRVGVRGEREQQRQEGDDGAWHAPDLSCPSGCGKRLPPRTRVLRGRGANGEAAREATRRQAVRGEGILPRGVPRAQRADRRRARRGRGAGAAQVARRRRLGARTQRHAGGGVVAPRRGALRAQAAGRARPRAEHGQQGAPQEATGAPPAGRVAVAARLARRPRPAAARWQPEERALVAAARERALRAGGGWLRDVPAPSDGARDGARRAEGGAGRSARGSRRRRRPPVLRRRERARDGPPAGPGGMERSRRPPRVADGRAPGTRGRRRAGEPLPSRRCRGRAVQLRRIGHALHGGRLHAGRAALAGRVRAGGTPPRTRDSARACSSCARPTRWRSCSASGSG